MASVTQLHPAEISPREWEIRCDLAALYRAFVRYGWTDLIYTHISARLPDEPTHYLINPYGLLFDEITASSLIVVDYDGNLVRGDWPVNEAGHAIHHAILKARQDVNWVLHTHTRAGMAVSCMKGGLLPITQQAMFYHGRIAYHSWDLQTSGQEECDRLVADLGTHNVAILENHGLLACGKTPGEAFLDLYNVENACKVQVDVLASGREIIMPTEAALKRTMAAADDAEFNRADDNWRAVRRVLDKADPSYMT
jgi:ribulose-5-phosphate 4-epimerase/fuculose-1-phosphate aldolase